MLEYHEHQSGRYSGPLCAKKSQTFHFKRKRFLNAFYKSFFSVRFLRRQKEIAALSYNYPIYMQIDSADSCESKWPNFFAYFSCIPRVFLVCVSGSVKSFVLCQLCKLEVTRSFIQWIISKGSLVKHLNASQVLLSHLSVEKAVESRLERKREIIQKFILDCFGKEAWPKHFDPRSLIWRFSKKREILTDNSFHVRLASKEMISTKAQRLDF